MNETEIFQHYQVLRREDGSLWELGRGAMGITYKAFDTNLRCHVALKVVSAQHLHSEVARQRFIREARAAAQLRHRHIATVYHLGMDPQNFFYSMEFIDGETLEALVERVGPLGPETVLRIALQTARALAAAARQGLIHRDIKPANLMVLHEDEDGEDRLLVKVIDFGLARSFAGEDAGAPLTVTGFVGTPQYASPEQLEEKDLDVRSDIYSLGVTLWFLLTGRPPFAGKLTQVITRHLNEEPPWDHLGDCPARVRELLEGMLRKAPAQRFQSATELRREIEVCLGFVSDGDSGSSANRRSGLAHRYEVESAAREGSMPPTPRGVGDVIGERFELLRLVGEGGSGKVFQARDQLAKFRTVAVKVYHPPWFAAPQAYQRFSREANNVRAVPHPGLVEVILVRRWRHSICLVMEWTGGITLVDVLRQRGTLSIAEALALLRQAAAAADHACSHQLGGLRFDLHQVLILPPVDPPAETEIAAAAFLSRVPLAGTLKLDALAGVRGSDEVATWAGGITMPPVTIAGAYSASDGDGDTLEGRCLRGLARLFYELVGGAPPLAFYAALPRLCEASNAVLRTALAPGPGFGRSMEFFEALARAEGLDPTNLDRKPSPPWLVQPGPEPKPSSRRADGFSAPGASDATASIADSNVGSFADATAVPLTGRGARGSGDAPAAGRGFPRWRLSLFVVVIAMFFGGRLIFFQWSPEGRDKRFPATRSQAEIMPFQTQAMAEEVPATNGEKPPEEIHPDDKSEAPSPDRPSLLLNPFGGALAGLTTEPMAFDRPSGDGWINSTGSWPPPAVPLLAPASQSQPDEGPMGAMVASAWSIQPTSEALHGPAAAAEDDSADAPVSSQRKTSHHTRSHQGGRPSRAPRPNFLQRLFGIKPKSRSK